MEAQSKINSKRHTRRQARARTHTQTQGNASASHESSTEERQQWFTETHKNTWSTKKSLKLVLIEENAEQHYKQLTFL